MDTLKGAIPLPKKNNSDYATLEDERSEVDLRLNLDVGRAAGEPVVGRPADGGQGKGNAGGIEDGDEVGTSQIARRDKGKGKARDDIVDDRLELSNHSQARSVSNMDRLASPINSGLDGDLGVSSPTTSMGDYLSPTAAEGRSPFSNNNPITGISSSTGTTSNPNVARKNKQREKDTRWDLDTMDTSTSLHAKSTRSRSPLADEYTEPHWNARTGSGGGSGAGLEEFGSGAVRTGAGGRAGEAGGFAGLGSGDYPSASEEVEEEKRIQDNLASLAAKEAARRRAARSSKAFVARPSGGLSYTPYEDLPTSNSTSSTTSTSSSTLARRASTWLGGLTGGVPGFGRLGGVQEEEQEVVVGRRGTRMNPGYGEPIPQSPIPSPIPGPSSISRSASPIPRPPSTNPFESELDHAASARNSPTRSQQPGIDLEPRARGNNAQAGPSRSTSTSSRSTVMQQQQNQQTRRNDPSDLERTVSSVSTLTQTQDDGYVRMEDSGWKGPAWRGGAGARESGSTIDSPTRLDLDNNESQSRYGYPSSSSGMRGSDQVFSRIGPTPQSRPRMAAQQREVRRDKWWYALCSWGSELDDGEDGQGGRTNPFE